MSPLKYTIIKRGKYTMGYICSELSIGANYWSLLLNGKRSASQALAEKCAATCNRLFDTDIFTASDFQQDTEESHL
jgi:hypothetical protein